MRDSTTKAGKTGLTVAPQRTIDGGALGACANSVAEVGSGYYKIDLDAGDLDGDTIGLLFTAPGADPVAITIVTEP
jgi:hypothetical protein